MTTIPEDLPLPQIEEALRRIAECKRMRSEELHIGGLYLREIPEEVLELTWLKGLHCGLGQEVTKKEFWQITEEDPGPFNALHALPEGISLRLRNLEVLDLRCNRFAQAVELGEIVRLTKLKSLDLSNNRLTALPAEIGRLTALTELWLNGNDLSALPPQFGSLTALTTLWLHNNGLAMLPPEFGCLKALTTLWLHNNNLTVLPPEIGRMTALDLLSLHYNGLTALPADIGRLTALRALWLHNNSLTALPPEIGQLTALTVLSLHNNSLTALLPEIGRLTALSTLFLNNNSLKTLPPEIGCLTALKAVWLNDNKLTLLPPEIGRLTALTELWLNGNALTALPPEIGHLTALTTLFLYGNPLHTPPLEIAAQGAEGVKAFFAEPRQPVHEAKVVLVGERAAGKTQLREWLVYGEYRSPGESTRVLEVRNVSFPNPQGPSKQGLMNIWDFGGDDDYRPCQQIFFTVGALYLMLFNARNTMGQGRVEDWLRLIRLRVGPRARVLLVGTNWVDGDQLPNLNALSAELRGMCVTQPDGRPFLINSKDDKNRPVHGLLGPRGLIERVHLEVTSLGSFQAEYPSTWLAARDAILDRRSYKEDDAPTNDGPPKAIWYRMDEYPERATFYSLATLVGVKDDHVPIVARALSNTGRLTFKGDPNRPLQWVVLDSEWLMKAVGYVLSASEVRENGGVFERRHFEPVWWTHARRASSNSQNHTRYHQSVHNELVRQMALHDICYKLDDDRWLVPQCVSLDAPKSIPWTFPDRASGGIALRLVCSMTDKIHGLAAVLTARNSLHHPAVTRHAWQTGFFVRKANGRAEGLLRIDGENKVEIETRGPEALDFRAELKGSLDKLMHDVWPAAIRMEVLPYTYSVPCPTCSTGSYNLQDLTMDFREHESTSRCEGGKRCRNEVFELLNGFSIPIDRDTREQRRYRSNEPPHIITVTKLARVGGVLGYNIRIDIHCEYDDSNGPVPGATETIPFDSKIWLWLKEWGPGLFKSAAKAVFYGDVTDVEIPDRKLIGAADVGLAVSLEKTGRIERPENRQVIDELREVLVRAALKGNMRQVEMRNTGYLLWVAPGVADGQDPNIAKVIREK